MRTPNKIVNHYAEIKGKKFTIKRFSKNTIWVYQVLASGKYGDGERWSNLDGEWSIDEQVSKRNNQDDSNSNVHSSSNAKPDDNNRSS